MLDQSNKKYKFTHNSVMYGDKRLYQIVALKSFGSVLEGDTGGYIQSEKNLSHEGNCWVADNAVVFDNARIEDNAYIGGNAAIGGTSLIYGDTFLIGRMALMSDADICASNHCVHIDTIGDNSIPTTFYRTQKGIDVAQEVEQCLHECYSIAEFQEKVENMQVVQINSSLMAIVTSVINLAYHQINYI